MEDQLFVKGSKNLKKLIESLSDTSLQILITLDSHQASKPDQDKNYSVDVEYPEYSGNHFKLEVDDQ
jgi:hypothetical protein